MPEDAKQVKAQDSRSQPAANAALVGESASAALDAVKARIQYASYDPLYDDHSEIPFPWKILEYDGWQQAIREIIQQWINNKANIDRIKRITNRSPSRTGFDSIVCGYFIFSLNERKHEQKWMPMKELGIHLEHKETVIFLALEDLGPSNGFFMPLKAGQDVCVDSAVSVNFPPTGGGVGVCFVLRI